MVDFFGIFRNGVRDGSGVLRLPAAGGVIGELYRYTNNVNNIQRSPSSSDIGSLLRSTQMNDTAGRAKYAGGFMFDQNNKVMMNNSNNNNNNTTKISVKKRSKTW